MIKGSLCSEYVDGEGHVRHPSLAPDVSTIAVYHQLHCLQSIEKHFAAELLHIHLAARESAHPIKSESLIGFPLHISHCFDYLRQALLCAADSNLEPLDPKLYGAHTAIPKTCRDISKVADWANKWASPRFPAEELDQIRSRQENVY